MIPTPTLIAAAQARSERLRLAASTKSSGSANGPLAGRGSEEPASTSAAGANAHPVCFHALGRGAEEPSILSARTLLASLGLGLGGCVPGDLTAVYILGFIYLLGVISVIALLITDSNQWREAIHNIGLAIAWPALFVILCGAFVLDVIETQRGSK